MGPPRRTVGGPPAAVTRRALRLHEERAVSEAVVAAAKAEGAALRCDPRSGEGGGWPLGRRVAPKPSCGSQWRTEGGGGGKEALEGFCGRSRGGRRAWRGDRRLGPQRARLRHSALRVQNPPVWYLYIRFQAGLPASPRRCRNRLAPQKARFEPSVGVCHVGAVMSPGKGRNSRYR